MSHDTENLQLSKLKDGYRRIEAKHEELKGFQAKIMEQEDKNDEEEKTAVLKFEENVEETKVIIRNLMDRCRIYNAILDIRSSLKNLERLQSEQPDRNHSFTIQELMKAYAGLKTMLEESALKRSHQHYSDLAELQTQIGLRTSTVPTPMPEPIRCEVSHSSSTYRRDETLKPRLDLPKFHGNIMHWNSFWTSFCGAIGDDPHISKVNKLVYLKGCIKDDKVNPIIFSGIDNEYQYDEVVAHLKQLYDQPKIIHAAYCNKMREDTPIKNTQTELSRYANDIKYVIMGLKRLKQYDIESAYASWALQRP